MTQYAQADKLLTGRNHESRKVGNNTYLQRRGDDIAVMLHATDIVTFHPDGTFTLNTGGWHTPTTLDRLREWAPVSIETRGIESGCTGERIGISRDSEADIKWYVSHVRGGPQLPLVDGHRYSESDVREWTDAEREENAMRQEISMPRASTGVYSTNRYAVGADMTLTAHRVGKVWNLQVIDADGATQIAQAQTLRECRRLAMRFVSWNRAQSAFDNGHDWARRWAVHHSFPVAQMEAR